MNAFGFVDYLNSMIDEANDKVDTLKRCAGKVVEVDETTDGGKATVECMNRRLTLLNKTGENLAIGDSVWVHYWTNLANGYIALRNGLPNGGSSFSINNAVAMLENQASVYTVSTEVFDIDIKHSIKAKYGNPHNLIIASNIPIVVTSLDNSNTIAEIYPTISAIPSGVLSTERKIEVGNVETGIYTSIIGSYSSGWSWGADVLIQTPMTVENVEGTNIYNICYTSSDNYTLRRANGSKAYFTSFTDLGLALLTAQIQSATTEMPYGYAVCRAVCVASYDKDDSAIAVSKISQRTINVPFASEAEYNYAVCTLTKSEINPSNGGGS